MKSLAPTPQWRSHFIANMIKSPLDESPINVNPELSQSFEVAAGRTRSVSGCTTLNNDVLDTSVLVVNIRDLVSLLKLADNHKLVNKLGDYSVFYKRNLKRAINLYAPLDEVRRVMPPKLVLDEPLVILHLFSLTKNFTPREFSKWYSQIIGSDPNVTFWNLNHLLCSHAIELEQADVIQLQTNWFPSVKHTHEFPDAMLKLCDNVNSAAGVASSVKQVLSSPVKVLDTVHDGFDAFVSNLETNNPIIPGIDNSVIRGLLGVITPLVLTYLVHRGLKSTAYRISAGLLLSITLQYSPQKFQTPLKTFAAGAVMYWFLHPGEDEGPTGEEPIQLQSSLVTALLCTYFVQSGFSREHTNLFTNTVRGSRDLSSLIDAVVTIFKDTVNVISSKVVGYEVFSEAYLEIEHLEIEYDALMIKANSGKMEFSHETADRVRVLRTEYRQIVLSKSNSVVHRNLCVHASKRLNTLENLLKSFDGFLADPTGLRQEPTSICISGPPGTFKTNVATHIINACLDISLTKTGVNWKANRSNYIYNRKTEDFWEGYNALTEVLSFDDFGQQRDSVGSPNVNYIDLINSYNTAPFPLPMAAVENKGKHFMKAKWILATTNQMDGFMVNSLVSNEAVNRRFDLNITIHPRYEYSRSDGTFNTDHPDIATDTLGYYNISPYMYTYEINSCTRIPKDLGYKSGSRLSYDELKAALSLIHATKSAIYEASVSNLQNSPGLEMQSGFLNKLVTDYIYRNTVPPDNITMEKVSESRKVGPLPPTIDGSWPAKVAHYSYSDLKDEIVKLNLSDGMIATIDFLTAANIRSDSMKFFDIEECDRLKLSLFYALVTIFRTGLQVHCPITTVYAVCSAEGLEAAARYLIEDRPENHIIRPKFKIRFQSLFGSIKDKLDSLCGDSYWIKVAGSVVLAIGSVTALWYTTSAALEVMSEFFPPVEDQSNYLTPKVSKIKINKSTGNRKAERVQFQGGDLTSFNLLKRFKKNLYTIIVCCDGCETVFGKGIFVDSSHFLMPKHFLDDSRFIYSENPDSVMILRNVNDYKFSIPQMFKNCVVYDARGEHCVMVKLDSMNFPKKDLTPHFLTDQDVGHLPSQGLSVLVSLPSLGDVPVISEARLDKIDFKVLRMAKGIHYSVDSGKGDCGSPIFLRDTRFADRRLMGFHIAGTPKGYSSRNAYASFITRECVDIMRNELSPPLIVPSSPDLELQGVVNAPIFEIIGTSPHYHDPYNTTKIVPSPLQRTSYPKPTKTPAVLYPRDGNDPLAVAFNKLRFKDVDPDERCLALAVEDLKSFMSPPDIIHLKDWIEFSEVLYGNPLVPNRVSIPVSTSAGYPCKFTDRDIKKRILPRDTPHFDVTTYNKLKDVFHHVILKANAGIRLDWYYLLTLKDETRSEEKVLAWDNRLFCGTPFLLFAVTKSLFGQFVEFFFTDCLDKENASTLNPYQGWKTLALKLSKFDESFKDARVDSSDFKAFDASNNPTVMLEVLSVIQNWYRQQGLTEHERAREIIFCEVYNSKHICQDKIYEWHSSLPSGSYLTLVVNCLTNMLLFRYSYYKIVPRSITAKHSFRSRVSFVCLGDDNAYSAHKDIRDVYTPVSISLAVKDLGFTMTSDAKTELGEWRTFATISFLKRGFRFSGKDVLAPLDLNTLHNTPQWTKRGPLFKKIFSDNLVFFFRELSLHSEEVWGEKSTLMLNTLRDLSEPLSDNPDLNRSQAWWREVVMSSDYFSVEM
nr:MAG: polyprotein 1 [Picornavirales sp.]